MNYNFHQSMDEQIHRLVNALEPNTYHPQHRHSNPDKEEVYLVLRGSLLAITFDDNGTILTSDILSPAKGTYGVEIPAGTWHSIIVLEPDTVIYEMKQGPYAPIIPSNIAPWAPEASDEEGVKKYIADMLESCGINR